MKFMEIYDIDSKEFKEAWKIYESSFSLDERRTLESQKEIMKDDSYTFFAINENNVIAAILCVWDLGDFLFIEHLAVREDLRNKGLGTKILKKFLSENDKKIVLEVKKPESEIDKKRIKFYESVGFNLNLFDYIQPPYEKGKDQVPMFLMSYPKKLSREEFSLIKNKLYTIVYRWKK